MEKVSYEKDVSEHLQVYYLQPKKKKKKKEEEEHVSLTGMEMKMLMQKLKSSWLEKI